MTEYFQLSSEVLIELQHETDIGNFSLLNRCRHHRAPEGVHRSVGLTSSRMTTILNNKLYTYITVDTTLSPSRPGFINSVFVENILRGADLLAIGNNECRDLG